jgi:hypothetical protein
MKKIKASNILAVIAICIGAFWIYGMLILPAYHLFTKPSDASDILFSLLFFPLMSTFGFFPVFFGIVLLKEKNKENIKGTVGALTVFGASSLAMFIENNIIQQLPPQILEGGLSIFIATLLAIPAYILVSKFLMKQEDLTPDSRGEFIGKGILFIIAFQMWMVGSSSFEAYGPVAQGYSYLKKEPWNLIGFVAPILAAILFYKLAIHFLKIKTPTRRKFSL